MMKRLLEIMCERSVLHASPDKPFVLKSGATSLRYVDVRLMALLSDGAPPLVIGRPILDQESYWHDVLANGAYERMFQP